MKILIRSTSAKRSERSMKNPKRKHAGGAGEEEGAKEGVRVRVRDVEKAALRAIPGKSSKLNPKSHRKHLQMMPRALDNGCPAQAAL